MISRQDSHRVSLEHLNAHTDLPPVLVPALLAAEMEYRVTNRRFFSNVCVYKNKRWFVREMGLCHIHVLP